MKSLGETSISKSAHERDAPEALFDRRLELVAEAIDLYHTYLHSYLFSLTHHWQDAQDLAQELWRHVLLHFPLEKIGQLGLLRRKAYQLFVDRYRSRRRRSEILTDELEDLDPAPPDREAFTQAEEAALKERFWAEYPGIDLTDTQKEALWQHARYGYTYEEIAERIGVPKSTIGDWIALGRKKLKEQLEG